MNNLFYCMNPFVLICNPLASEKISFATLLASEKIQLQPYLQLLRHIITMQIRHAWSWMSSNLILIHLKITKTINLLVSYKLLSTGKS
jgi:hypothetical protein